VFRWLQEQGDIPEPDLWNTFNLGVGFCLVVPPEAVAGVIGLCQAQGHQAWELGLVAAGDPGLSSAGGTVDQPLAGLPY
jgi:phosphoribosylformylglycinamidine cyclo-ligase